MTENNLDADVATWLIRVMPDRDPATVEQARADSREQNAAALAEMDPALVPAGDEDGEIPADGDAPALPIRILRPATTPGGSEIDRSPMMTIVFLHGGGWVVGDLETHLGHARRLCAQVHAVVVMIGYRLAPEHRFPAAFDDAVRGTEWVAQHLAELGGDETLVVAGDSAGGQLAASVAIARRDAGQRLDAQLLLYPVTDVAGRYVDPQVNAGYMSRGATHKRFGLTLEGMVNFSNTYVDERDSADWRVSPKRAASLAGVAPAVIHTSTLDVLRTEGNFFGDDLRAAGVDVIAREHPSLNHSYFGLGGVSTVADAAASQAAEDLHELLARRR
ncbi:alpha/beta hydrolase [Jatrophihabitans endophyticus]|uniref:alpha/beta hydrolase n=1 Tax=Jatrophihabitans endophyticus TaxID=1206085 RepID=UPI0026EF3152|nr:alpha/beta hydrolase [Jatrophihabitans endophyticus]